MICGQLEKSRAMKTLFLLFGLLLATVSAPAQSYSINWSTVDGGGGTSTGGVYSVSSTIGQPDAGKLSGGNYTVDGGFWGVVAAVQSPGAPLLTVAQNGNQVLVSWPSPSTGYVLQQNPNVGNTNGWVNSAYSIMDTNGLKSISLTSPTGNLFFRLKQ
jgi:hypothetical protein